jgi:flagellar basal-body rod protein FlgF
MIRGIYTAAAGMLNEMARQEVVANNLANVNTTAFKKDLAVFRARDDKPITRIESEGAPRASGAEATEIGRLSTGAFLDRVFTEYSQGPLRRTDEPFDLAMTGPGFLVLRDGNGQELLSRGGKLTRSEDGRLVDLSGHEIQGDGGPIVLPGQGAFKVDQQGVVHVGREIVGKIRVVEARNPADTLEKQGASTWKIRDPGAIAPATATQVEQGSLEASNVNPVREMVDLIAIQRAYEASQRVITAQDETLGKAVNELGRG